MAKSIEKPDTHTTDSAQSPKGTATLQATPKRGGVGALERYFTHAGIDPTAESSCQLLRGSEMTNELRKQIARMTETPADLVEMIVRPTATGAGIDAKRNRSTFAP
jgi:hypothetical protein